MQQQDTGRMNRQVGFHGSNHSNVIGTRSNVRKKLTDPHAAATVLRKFPRTFDPFASRITTPCFALVSSQGGFGIECIDVRDSAVHKQKDDVLRRAGKMCLRIRGTKSTLLTQRRPRQHPKPGSAGLQ